jgi:hypothetical protein
MRRGGLLVLVVVALCAGCGADKVDKGVDRPPEALTEDRKALWMTEWVACWRVKVSSLSSILHVTIKDATPQQAARKVARRAMQDLYESRADLRVGADGCRNGILWRWYHPPA